MAGRPGHVEDRGRRATRGGDAGRRRAGPARQRLDQLVDVLRKAAPDEEPYVRCSLGPDADLFGTRGPGQSSRDALTGIDLPGFSANPLAVEP
ncbi:DUF6098 family protein [Micromonospora citrea]|uniref:DUF6098 family protein n=1 Tax=Micromonospora citrea TaxID=47855 RepID=UPI00247FD640|nr:DUF6098 family protein [Micromonospora citrea]